MNGIFINMLNRESQGTVEQSEAGVLKQEIMEKLANVTDPKNGEPMVTRVYDGQEVYQGNNTQEAPDIVVGYARSYRASWETVLGAVPQALVYDNDTKWSGDHSIDPAHVPGVLFTSFSLDQPVSSIADIHLLVKQAGAEN